MGQHQVYVEGLLMQLLGDAWDPLSTDRSINIGGVRADLDGIIHPPGGHESDCVVEIEARVPKQIRGSIVDLALHPAPKRLLIIVPAQPQTRNRDSVKKHLDHIWTKLFSNQQSQFKVVVLKGTAHNPAEESDLNILAEVLQDYGLLETRMIPSQYEQPGDPPATRAPTTEDFTKAIKAIKDMFRKSEQAGETNIVISAGELHRKVGGYPGPYHRMPSCCKAMRTEKRAGDIELKGPPNGSGASLTIRYRLPR